MLLKELCLVLVTTIIISVLNFRNMAFGLNKFSGNYSEDRKKLLELENSQHLGVNLVLSDKEKILDRILLTRKIQELNASYINASNFLPSQHFFLARKTMEKSEVLSFIRRIPKGGSLHTHLLGSVSVDFLMEKISYRDNLYGGHINGVFKLRFLDDPGQDTRTKWRSLENYRRENGSQFNAWLVKQLSLVVEETPREAYPCVAKVWEKFKKIFNTTYEMLCYRPVFEDYVYQALEELYSDNVMYAEFRSTAMPLYELNQTVYSTEQFFQIFVKVVEKFKQSHPKFIGARYIHSIYRGVTKDTLRQGLDELVQLKKLFPDFIAGFDFVGYEEEGRTLNDYSEELLRVQPDLKFFFHAGETNWFGHTDLNLVDAILLNSSRIGHGFTLLKHPVLCELAKERNIAVEVCPISNQVLMLNEDPRNHPAANFVATGYPVVVCNDDPGLWGATGLSYDWYVMFLAMTSKNHGLKVLKQLAINSLEYSALSPKEKEGALTMWNGLWDEFLDSFLK